jgi:hypothetical protein
VSRETVLERGIEQRDECWKGEVSRETLLERGSEQREGVVKDTVF